MIPYRAMLDVPAELLRYLSRLLAAERRLRGTPAVSRRLSFRDQAVLALGWFRSVGPLPRRRPRNAVPRRQRLRGSRNRHPRPREEDRSQPPCVLGYADELIGFMRHVTEVRHR